jgi:hypothetical protein
MPFRSRQDEFIGVKGGKVSSFLLLDHLLQVVDVAGASLYIQFGAAPEAELALVVHEDEPNSFGWCVSRQLAFTLSSFGSGWWCVP